MKKYLLMICLLSPILGSCSTTPYEVQLTRKIMNSFSQEIKNENLNLIGSGTSFPDKLNKFCLRFVTQKNVNINEARSILVNTANKFLQQVNANSEIRPWMSQYPFTSQNLDLIILFNDKTGKEAFPPNIAWVSVNGGKIYYDTHDHDKNRFVNVFTETYDEAVKKIQNAG